MEPPKIRGQIRFALVWTPSSLSPFFSAGIVGNFSPGSLYFLLSELQLQAAAAAIIAAIMVNNQTIISPACVCECGSFASEHRIRSSKVAYRTIVQGGCSAVAASIR